MIAARIIADSVNETTGDRITTFLFKYPRFIHSELMTHRAFSRNAASSRAIPVEKTMKEILSTPARPVFWGANQKGMQADIELPPAAAQRAIELWDESARLAVQQAQKFTNIQVPDMDRVLEVKVTVNEDLIYRIPHDFGDEALEVKVTTENDVVLPGGLMQKEPGRVVLRFDQRPSSNFTVTVAPLKTYAVHKQIANRIMEPFAHMLTLVTATEYENFFALRVHKDAQPEFQCLAGKALGLYLASQPERKAPGEWHLPFAGQWPDDITEEGKLKVCTARAARTSYKTFDGDSSIEKDIDLHDRLKKADQSGDPGHWSPFEHPAQALPTSTRSGNFMGWMQYRKLFVRENITEVNLQERFDNRRQFLYDDTPENVL